MKRKRRNCVALLICLSLWCSMFTVRAADDQVKISQREYAINVSGWDTFFGNNTPVSGEVGSKVFLTYTVDKVRQNTCTMHGVLGTKSLSNQPYVYVDGGMYYGGPQLFEEGATYMFRFERTNEGFKQEVIRMKGNTKERLIFPSFVGQQDGAYKYFGVWIGAEQGQMVDVDLIHVRCYDEEGNDLGVFPYQAKIDAHVDRELLDKHLIVDQSYDFEVIYGTNVMISNAKPLAYSNSVVYMEYEVVEVSQDDTLQTGLSVNNQPNAFYPHTDGLGYMRYDRPGLLTVEGAKYFICFQKTEDDLKVTWQCTKDGVTTTDTFGATAGTYDSHFPYYTLYMGEGGQIYFKMKNFKCYDEKGNNLGVQFNSTLNPTHPTYYGPVEDYSLTEATYYCEETDSLIVLQDGKKAFKDVAGVKESANYKIVNNQLALVFEDGKEAYSYHYLLITDDEENEYKRLKSSKVTFVVDGEKIVKKANAKNGYRIEKPEEPKKKGDTFVGWYLADGTEFQLERINTESVTVYAKWKNGDGHEYIETEAPLINGLGKGLHIAMGVSALILVATVGGCIIITRKRKGGV